MAKIIYNYFLGCTSYVDVKARYKTLAKELHPDKATGSHEKFVAMQAEYDILGEGNYYPIRNIAVSEFEQNVNNVSEFFRQASKMYTKEQTTHIDPKEVEKQRAEAHFNSLRQNDNTFDLIDGILSKAKKENLSKLWLYQEVQKQWDLNSDHFKYMTYKCGDTVATANQLFRKYQLSRV
jgi:hypothetical protein